MMDVCEQMPLVSVIIPAFNAEPYIKECIESVLNQTYKNIEIIICDDFSTDGTRNVLGRYRKYKEIQILYNKRNLHQAAARNRCIARCKGKYILIQDADDCSEPYRIEKLMRAFEENIAFVGSRCCYFDENGPYFNSGNLKDYPKRKDLLSGIPFVHASILFKKECLEAAGGYRVSRLTRRAEDYDLILRLYGMGYRGRNINDVLYWYRVNRDTLLRRDFKSRIAECGIRFQGYKKNGILFPVGIFYSLKPIPAFFYHILKNRKRLAK